MNRNGKETFGTICPSIHASAQYMQKLNASKRETYGGRVHAEASRPNNTPLR
jgi:hypothetical protein